MKISTVETERVCYTCGKPGHLARECRRTKSTQPMGSNLCFSCNYEGHWARDCPRNAPEEHKPGSQNFGRRFVFFWCISRTVSCPVPLVVAGKTKCSNRKSNCIRGRYKLQSIDIMYAW
ncbi:hypothetical protein JTB14_021859 [Gonioctena quinquepunctata]|nr:hypothetical protein JTB14_021859 [Gonioctena quinquepunctata]